MLDTIYAVRHGFRSNWVTDPASGESSAEIISPTGIPSDPPLSSHGVDQARELAKHIAGLEVKPEKIYTSPFYRCLQTIDPIIEAVEREGAKVEVVAENGVGEWFGRARFEHPSPASVELLHRFFPKLLTNYVPVIIPSSSGESEEEIHDRVAYAIAKIIESVDKEWIEEGKGPGSILICAHAASNIAIGRVLTGDRHLNVHVGTCSLSIYKRRPTPTFVHPPLPSPTKENPVPFIDWKNGKGVGGEWDILKNGDCTFLSKGEERNWWFAGDEDWDFPVKNQDPGSAARKDSVSKLKDFGGPGTVSEEGTLEQLEAELMVAKM